MIKKNHYNKLLNIFQWTCGGIVCQQNFNSKFIKKKLDMSLVRRLITWKGVERWMRWAHFC